MILYSRDLTFWLHASLSSFHWNEQVPTLTLYPVLIIYPLLTLTLTLDKKVTKCISQNVSFQAAVSTFFVLCGYSTNAPLRTIKLKLTPSLIITEQCDWN